MLGWPFSSFMTLTCQARRCGEWFEARGLRDCLVNPREGSEKGGERLTLLFLDGLDVLLGFDLGLVEDLARHTGSCLDVNGRFHLAFQ